SCRKDGFRATLAHDSRRPLDAVIGWARVLRAQPAIRSQAHALEVIERNAISQMRLVEDLLDMARIISGKLRLNVDAVSITGVAKAAVDVVAPAAAAKQITVEVWFDDELPTVTGDADRLQQVVWNLLSNAVKFTDSDGSVRLQVKRDDGRVRLSVRDSGQGISRGFLPHRFARFR